MNDILARLWQNLYGRLSGPLNLRLIIQPAVATILAIRAGLRDAHQDRAPFFWAVLWNPAHRRELLREGWKDVGKVFLIATILDVVYQLIVHRGVYILEFLITAVTLSIVPYVLVRGPVTGGPTILRDYLQRKRPQAKPTRAFIRMEPTPGERFEVD